MHEVKVPVLSIDRFTDLLGRSWVEALRRASEALKVRLNGRAVWNINSTAAGGGVAELLHPLVGYARGEDIDARWGVIAGSPDFYRLTKRLHNSLHGDVGDATPLNESMRSLYEETLLPNAVEMGQWVRAGDVVVLHDPQTLGLAGGLSKLGAHVVWRSHIGADAENEETARGWRFLRPYLSFPEGFVFSRSAYVPPIVDRRRTEIIPPSIDPFSPKNEQMGEAAIRAILVHTGLVEGPRGTGEPAFRRDDGSPGRVDHAADILRLGRAPKFETPLVVQVSRWDRLKDPIGVMRGFTHLLEPSAPANAELVLAGPTVRAVADDPEGATVFEEVLTAWRELPHLQRLRIHLVNLPMGDVEENAAIVNALQRHATVVVQKSLQEGFGLTVTEAMWKARPILASAVGGIQDQIEDGVHGILLKDPTDDKAFAALLRGLLEDPERSKRLGHAAQARVKAKFLGLHSLSRYAQLLLKIL